MMRRDERLIGMIFLHKSLPLYTWALCGRGEREQNFATRLSYSIGGFCGLAHAVYNMDLILVEKKII